MRTRKALGKSKYTTGVAIMTIKQKFKHVKNVPAKCADCSLEENRLQLAVHPSGIELRSQDPCEQE